MVNGRHLWLEKERERPRRLMNHKWSTYGRGAEEEDADEKPGKKTRPTQYNGINDNQNNNAVKRTTHSRPA